MRPTSAVAIVLWFAAAAAAQAEAPKPAASPAAPAVAPTAAPDPVAATVAAMQAAERAARSFRIELSTEVALPGDIGLRTAGSLRVLRTEQAGVPETSFHTRVQVEFADGLRAAMESVQRADGIWMLEDSPAFGIVHLHIEPRLVADLEWAGEVLDRSDLPGMADGRADAPLGSRMLAGLARQFVLAPDSRTSRGSDTGRWFVGPRRAVGDGDGADLPLADRVELFVRDRDQALLEVVQWLGDTAVQRITVASLEVDAKLDPASFVVDGKGAKVREVQQHLPMWEQIEQILKQAERQAGESVVRPSRR